MTVTIVRFPLILYTSYYRERRYGLLAQTLSDFVYDRGKTVLIGCVVGSIFVMIVYGILRRAPRWWWAWLSGVALAFSIVGMAVAPVLILPMFNRFTPIESVAIRDNILNMAHDQGISADEVYQVDAS